MTDDEFFMRQALEEAKIAFNKKEVPAGAVIVFENKIIARAHNLVESTLDATMHAEIQAIRQAESFLGNWRLSNCLLYTTLEPCSMCAGAAILARIKKIVYGAPDLRHGANGGWVNLFIQKHPIHNIECRGGILAQEASLLLKNFFAQVRKEKDGKNF